MTTITMRLLFPLVRNGSRHFRGNNANDITQVHRSVGILVLCALQNTKLAATANDPRLTVFGQGIVDDGDS